MKLLARLALVITSGLLIGGGGTLATGTTARALSTNEVSFTVAATHVYVNRAGSITVDGTFDCSPAIAEAEARILDEDFEGQTVDFSVDPIMVGTSWTATQYAGRSAVNASYNPGIANACGGGTWQTLYPFPQGGQQWVPGTNGKFTSGRIVIDVYGEGSMTIHVLESGTSTVLATYEFDLYAWSENYLRAARIK